MCTQRNATRYSALCLVPNYLSPAPPFLLRVGTPINKQMGEKKRRNPTLFLVFFFFACFPLRKPKGGKLAPFFIQVYYYRGRIIFFFFFQQGTPMQRLVSLTFFMCLRVLDDHVATILILPSILIPFPLLFFPLPTAQKKKKRTEL